MDDVARGFLALAAYVHTSDCEIFNISSGMPTSIGDLAAVACRAAKLQTRVTASRPQGDDQNDRLVLSIDRIVETVGWRPRWTLEDALRETLSKMAVLDHG
jgi:nucleoside-diphosphate-sugar epimerase